MMRKNFIKLPYLKQFFYCISLFFAFAFIFVPNTFAYEDLIHDSSFPYSFGLEIGMGTMRVRDALIPNRKYEKGEAFCGPFAFLTEDKLNKSDQEEIANKSKPSNIMPLIFSANLVSLNTDILLLNRKVWSFFYGYPIIGLNIFFKRVGNITELFSPYGGNFYGLGIYLELHKEYWSDWSLFPKLNFSVGILDAPIDTAYNRYFLPHPHKSEPVQLTKDGPTKYFFGLTFTLGMGAGLRFNITDSLALKIILMSEYMFSTPLNNIYFVEFENDDETRNVKVYSEAAKKDTNKKFPEKTYFFSNALNLNVGVNYTINPSKSRYQDFESPRDTNYLDIGLVTFMRQINAYAKRETTALYPQKGKNSSKASKKDKADLSPIFPGFGIYGIYSFKSDWLRENLNEFLFNNISFLIGAEIIILDLAVNKKLKQENRGIIDGARFSLMLGLGLNDFEFLKFRILLGYDIVSFDYWGENSSEKTVGELFLSPEIQFVPFNKLAISLFSKVKPTKNYTSGGGGGILKKANYDLLFYEVGLKIGYLF